MKTTHFLWIILPALCIQVSTAQISTTSAVCNSESMVLQHKKGDTLLITCDTAYLLSKQTFHILLHSKQSHENLSASVNSMLGLVESGDSLYISYIEEMNKQYDALNKEFLTLADTSNQFINTANTHIENINLQLDSVNKSLENVNRYVTEAKEILEKENKNRWKTKVGWGLGGLTVGVGLSSVLVLLLN